MSDKHHIQTAAGHRDSFREEYYAWLNDGELPRSKTDLIAEGLALVALLLAVGIGLVIAVLPVSARAATAVAAAASAPSLELSAFKVVAALPGQPEHLEPAAQTRSGDQIEYRAVYRNPTAAPVRHVLVTVPVPAIGVDYVMETASPHADLASTDGKTFAPLPLMRIVTAADGRQSSKPAPSADYRFLRWDLGDVPAGATRTVRARVQVLSTSVAAAR